MNLPKIMKNKWWTIPKLQKAIKSQTNQYYMETTVSARIRDLRKAGYDVIKRHVKNGLWEYRVKEWV